MTDSAFDPFKAWQWLGAFGGTEAWRRSVGDQMEKFWREQLSLLDRYEKLAATLVEKRRAAIGSALEASRRLADIRDPQAFAKACNDYFTGTLAGMGEESRAFYQESLNLLTAMSQNMSLDAVKMAEAAAAQASAKPGAKPA